MVNKVHSVRIFLNESKVTLNMAAIPFEDLDTADLVVDQIYEGGAYKDVRDDPLTKLLPGVGNLGGFRIAGSPQPKYVVLYTSGEEKDWPDELDLFNGKFTYYGDNRTPGKELHDTSKGGNQLLRKSFESLHNSNVTNEAIPPFLIFKKHPTSRSSRAVRFLGLAVPGYPGLPSTEDLVAIWKDTDSKRFQNYRASFTILDIPVISRAWLNALYRGDLSTVVSPEAWCVWQRENRYFPLKSTPTSLYRSPVEQLPSHSLQQQILETVYSFFHAQGKKGERLFEFFAADLFEMFDGRVVIDSITRGSSDGGRDAIGRYQIGVKEDPIFVDFALEAKCYNPGYKDHQTNSVGVKEVARLVSRIRNRQFGVLITTSIVSRQTYEEVRRDGHPIIFISGKDIVDILARSGLNTSDTVQRFLAKRYSDSV